MRGAFDPEKAAGVDRSYEIRIDGSCLEVTVEGGEVSFPGEPTGTADVVIEADPGVLFELITGRAGLEEMTGSGRIRIEGRKADVRRFFEMFRMTAPVDALKVS